MNYNLYNILFKELTIMLKYIIFEKESL